MPPDSTLGRVGTLERVGPCQFCGREVSQYSVVGEPQRSFFAHEQPWCAEYTAIVTEQGLGAERNPQEDSDEEEEETN